MSRTSRTATVIGLAIALFGIGGLGLARIVGNSPATHVPARPPVPADDVSGAPGVSSTTSLAGTISALQARLRTSSGDWETLAQLGLAYVQQARITADPTYYPKAEGVLRRSLALDTQQNFAAMTGMAALDAARHDFAGALSWGERARAINAYNASIYAVIGDAQIELGRYPEAFDTYQRAIDLRPDLSTYARASYAWELQGNVTNAGRAMNLALQAASSASDAAWTDNQLGDLAFNRGDLEQAGSFYRRALAQDGSFIPPKGGLARVEAARGQTARAIADYRAVIERYPLPAYVVALDDLYTIAGQKAQAAEQTGLVAVEEKLFRANGVNVDLEIALFDADHHVNLAQGLAAAQAEWGRRHSVHVADALAWELFANGRPADALAYANEALHLGYRNALFFYHRGMIDKALGMKAAARRDLGTALDINPYFSILWSRLAASTLSALGGKA